MALPSARRGRLADETPGTRRLLAEYRQEVWDFTDRMFLWLLLGQAVVAIATALLTSPQPWDGLLGFPWLAWKALGLGVVISALPLIAVYSRPGSGSTRREIAVGQGLMTSLLIHVAGGRPEMHYAIFVSLPFLAMYRDISVLLLASSITVIDHVLACFLWPHSVYGVESVSQWAWVTDVWLMAVEDMVLAVFVIRKQADMLNAARKQATLDASRVGARARGDGAAAHGAATVVAIRDHARAGGLEQPAGGRARHPAHHGREPGVARRRAVGGRREPPVLALRGHLAHRRTSTATNTWNGARRCASRPTSASPAGYGSVTCRCGFRTSPRSRCCRWRC